MFETSDKMETCETFKPAYDASGKFIGLDHEAIFYDPEAFVAPVGASHRFVPRATPEDPNRRYTYIECLSNIQNIDGRPTQLSPSDPVRSITMAGAQNWEKNVEKGWEKDDEDILPKAILNLF